jgi:hypothetical protein
MSALLNKKPENKNNDLLIGEYGYSIREFHKNSIRVPQSDECELCMLLSFISDQPIPNRMLNYNNHFTLFRKEDEIIVVRVETSIE